MKEEHPNDPALWLETVIKEFIASSPENTLGMETGEKAFATPLVGFSSAVDPLYAEYKSHIGNFYFTPLELFGQSFPDQQAESEDLTVISWILPSTQAIRLEQAGQKRHPSERWARIRDLGEKCNNALRQNVIEKLQTAHIPAIAPLLSSLWSRSNEGPYAPCSNWSERHAAYAAGLGTFGLCDGLITPVGKAVRVGSVIASIKVAPSQRPYTDRHAYCLHFTHNTCRKCVDRCPVDALSDLAHDKNRCMEYTEHVMNKYIVKTFGLDTYACGLCQCGVPCMDHIPAPEEG